MEEKYKYTRLGYHVLGGWSQGAGRRRRHSIEGPVLRICLSQSDIQYWHWIGDAIRVLIISTARRILVHS